MRAEPLCRFVTADERCAGVVCRTVFIFSKTNPIHIKNMAVPTIAAILLGRVSVAGRSTADHRPRDLADVVGFVGQDPDATFVADIVEDELAYGMENLGVAPDAMRRRVEDVLDLLQLHDLRHRRAFQFLQRPSAPPVDPKHCQQAINFSRPSSAPEHGRTHGLHSHPEAPCRPQRLECR